MSRPIIPGIERLAYRMRASVFEQSRNAGQAITSKQVGVGDTSVGDMSSSAAHLADCADQLTASIKNRFRPRLDCKEGCSYCCRKPGVLVAVPELVRILQYVRANFSVAEQDQLANRAKRYGAQMKGRNCDDPTDESVPCPLLVDDRCSVYEVRPLVCRGYNSTDVNACRTAHNHSGTFVPIFALLKDVTDGITVGSVQELESRGFNGAMIDLGLGLGLSLAAGSGVEDRIVAGDNLLFPAENKSWARDLLDQVRRASQ